MVEFIVGLTLGALFAPFWMRVWGVVRNLPVVKPVVDYCVAFFR